MKPQKKARRRDVALIVLSAIDVITGILSLVIAALTIQIIALISSGLTLFKAVKIAVQSEKAAIFIKPAAIYAVQSISRSKSMKGIFGKIKECVKNNPITIVTALIELAACVVIGYLGIGYIDRFSWASGWKLYGSACGAAGVIYAVIVALTVYLGHDSSVSATIRKIAKAIGGEKAVEALDEAEEKIKAANEAAKKAEEEKIAEEARIAEEKAKDEEIYAKIIEEENRRKEAEKRAKIAAYKAAHPEER